MVFLLRKKVILAIVTIGLLGSLTLLYFTPFSLFIIDAKTEQEELTLLSNKKEENEPIRFDEKNFLDLILEVNKEPEKYLGRPVEISGYLIKEKVQGENKFYVARYVINACLADTVLMGLGLENIIEKETEEGRIGAGVWVHIEGTFARAKAPQQSGELIIIVKKATVEDEPTNPNIYVEAVMPEGAV
ncbi:TIGR03943 family putative permease subunit [Heliorestis convoluta]|uniref:DUF1980 domain-containing protein n=1 Tax=Heliorestis convoluta TaxID=356322 RepID=A0A5Q2N436_9FIRM|nr:hypothetical protein [Heliorestis convoluta]QGG47030.1 hypothetical protein FTV88_0874 [Heliorestis convoluta]